MLSEKKIKELVDKNKDLLEALEEFDRTGKLRKVKYKEKVTFTIDMDVMKKFRQYCEEQGVKMSAVLERLVRKELNV